MSLTPKYKIRTGYQTFTIPVAPAANEPTMINIDLSKIDKHIFQFRISNAGAANVSLFSKSGGLTLIPSAGADPSGMIVFPNPANVECRCMNNIPAFNADVLLEVQVLLTYDFIELIK